MDLSFAQYLLSGLQYYEVLLDSIDAAKVPLHTTNKIEKFWGNFSVTPEQMAHWKPLFTSG
ncbi:hypothetical protein Tco_1223415, partial [Tanacetum coccineum]